MASRYTDQMRQYFEEHVNQDVDAGVLMRKLDLGRSQVLNGMRALRANDPRYIIVKRGFTWRFNTLATPHRRVRTEMPAPAPKTTVRVNNLPSDNMIPVPASEPAVSFRVLGTTVETGELVLAGVSEGVSGVWMARRVN